jgi:hypothetical protein
MQDAVHIRDSLYISLRHLRKLLVIAAPKNACKTNIYPLLIHAMVYLGVKRYNLEA